MVFGQQRDQWFHAETVGFVAIAAIFIGLGLSSGWPANLVMYIIGIGVAVVTVIVLLPNYIYGRYELGEEAVHVRSYMNDASIPYENIISAGPVRWTETFVKTAATSLKFVEIHYREGRHKRRISFTPAERDRFVEELNSRIAQRSVSPRLPMAI
ncbi:PH domain-containing protein [Methanomassiliicoccus luminyensis]|uniref:PH domain-containing protein n=1 Tax=Methanomassiliicoccus luminyensis TaxID=1080712 RepID=UPI0003613D6B|nr:PH domain-containing protein [Methanomassiliicoccus luminyensis]